MKGTYLSGASAAWLPENLSDPGSFHYGARMVADGAPAEPQSDSAQSIGSSQTDHIPLCLDIALLSSTIAVTISLVPNTLREDLHQGRGHLVLETPFWQHRHGSILP